jgi:hypothetical protein
MGVVKPKAHAIAKSLGQTIIRPFPWKKAAVSSFLREITAYIAGIRAMMRPNRSKRLGDRPTRIAAGTLAAMSLFAGACFGASSDPAQTEPAPPSSPREFYNAGTEKLRGGKLREAESLLESALASQSDSIQKPSLYNLGQVRFGQGVEELKKGPSAASASQRAHRASQLGDQALRGIDDALAGDDVQKMVSSYMAGRGARKELKAAIAAVRRAMETYGSALTKWQRSSGDFKSVVELNNTDTDAKQNADTVDRSIAKLIDSLHEMDQACQGMCKQNGDLGEKLKKLKGKVPGGEMPGGPGDEDEDEDQPNGPQPGQREGPSKDGNEMLLSPEQAGWLLDGFRLDGERRLPMTEGQQGKPVDRARPTW